MAAGARTERRAGIPSSVSAARCLIHYHSRANRTHRHLEIDMSKGMDKKKEEKKKPQKTLKEKRAEKAAKKNR